MKILYIIDNLVRGGKERQLVELSKALSLNHDVELIVFSDEVHYKEILETNIQIHYLKKSDRKGISASRKIIKICKHFRPDLIHAWDHLSAVLSIPAKLIYNIKLIDSIRYAAQRNRFQGNWYITDLAFLFSDRVIANSNAGLVAHHKHINKKYRVIYNGFDFERLSNKTNKEELRSELGIHSKYCIGMVANFLKSKDHFTVIKAGIDLLNQQKEISFVFVGNGPTRPVIEQEIPADLKDHFIFLGKRNDVEKIIATFDIGVLLSNTNGHAEGISNALTEIMVQAVPVIATNAGGNPELIKNCVSGFLIDPFSKSDFTEKINVLIDNQKLRNEMGINAQKSVSEKFGMQRMINEYKVAYMDCINR